MKHIIVYMEHPRASEVRRLRQILGKEIQPNSVLPVVSEPIETDEELGLMLRALGTLEVYSDSLSVIVSSKDVEVRDISVDEAIDLAKADDSLQEFLKSLDVDCPEMKIRVKKHPHCCVVVFLIGDGGISSGIGFVVDNYSRRVMPRRLADVLTPGGEVV